MYGALFLGWVALVLTVEEGGNVVRAMREIPGLLVLSLGPFAPYVIMATTAAVAAAWLFRGLGTVRFRVVAVLLCCAPLMCVLSPEALRLLVPVQAVFGLIVTRPRWIHPLDVDTTVMAADLTAGTRGGVLAQPPMRAARCCGWATTTSAGRSAAATGTRRCWRSGSIRVTIATVTATADGAVST